MPEVKETIDTPGNSSFQVPSGVYSLKLALYGGQGGSIIQSNAGIIRRGGYGGGATATVNVEPGTTLQITVGDKGEDIDAIQFRDKMGVLAGGAGGIGDGHGGKGGSGYGTEFQSRSYGGAGGGGGTSVEIGGSKLIAGGGGGAADFSLTTSNLYGNGGGEVGVSGFGEWAGQGATQTQVGKGGDPITDGDHGQDGQEGDGGMGGSSDSNGGYGGGGGGGGFKGGGGGASKYEVQYNIGTGGGGAAGNKDGPLFQGAVIEQGVRQGSGAVILDFVRMEIVPYQEDVEIELGESLTLRAQLVDFQYQADPDLVEYFIYGPFPDQKSATCQNPYKDKLELHPTIVITQDAIITSPEYMPTDIGYYTWTVKYTQGNIELASSCEGPTRPIFKVTPKIVTSLNTDQVNVGDQQQVVLTATITKPGSTGFQDTGFLRFSIYGPFADPSEFSCTDQSKKTLLGSVDLKEDPSTEYQSQGFVPQGAGYYFFDVFFSQESIQVSTGCNGEAGILRAFSQLLAQVDQDTIEFEESSTVTISIGGGDEEAKNLAVSMLGPFLGPHYVDCNDDPRSPDNQWHFDEWESGIQVTGIPAYAGFYIWYAQAVLDGDVVTTLCDATGTSKTMFRVQPRLQVDVGTLDDDKDGSIIAGSSIPLQVIVSGIDFTLSEPALLYFALYGPFASLADVQCDPENQESVVEGVELPESGQITQKLTPKAAGFYTWTVSVKQGDIHTITKCGETVHRVIPGAIQAQNSNDQVVPGEQVSVFATVGGIQDFGNSVVKFTLFGPFDDPSLISCADGEQIFEDIVSQDQVEIVSRPYTPETIGYYGWVITFQQNGISTRLDCGQLFFQVLEYGLIADVSHTGLFVNSIVDLSVIVMGPNLLTSNLQTKFYVYGPFPSKTTIDCTESNLKYWTSQAVTSDATQVELTASYRPVTAGYYTWHVVLEETVGGAVIVETGCGDVNGNSQIFRADNPPDTNPPRFSLIGESKTFVAGETPVFRIDMTTSYRDTYAVASIYDQKVVGMVMSRMNTGEGVLIQSIVVPILGMTSVKISGLDPLPAGNYKLCVQIDHVVKCQSFSIKKVTPSLTLSLTEGVFLSGGFKPSGTLTFTFLICGHEYSNNSIVVNGNGFYSLSSCATRWKCTYSGDTNNESVTLEYAPHYMHAPCINMADYF